MIQEPHIIATKNVSICFVIGLWNIDSPVIPLTYSLLVWDHCLLFDLNWSKHGLQDYKCLPSSGPLCYPTTIHWILSAHFYLLAPSVLRSESKSMFSLVGLIFFACFFIDHRWERLSSIYIYPYDILLIITPSGSICVPEQGKISSFLEVVSIDHIFFIYPPVLGYLSLICFL